jgi:hypothetical protein
MHSSLLLKHHIPCMHAFIWELTYYDPNLATNSSQDQRNIPDQQRPVIQWRRRILQRKLPHRSKADTLPTENVSRHDPINR